MNRNYLQPLIDEINNEEGRLQDDHQHQEEMVLEEMAAEERVRDEAAGVRRSERLRLRRLQLQNGNYI